MLIFIYSLLLDSPGVSRQSGDSGAESSSSFDGDLSAARPDLSYAHLAALAIDASGLKRCTVGEIYAWIEARYPFFKSGCPWWKVRLMYTDVRGCELSLFFPFSFFFFKFKNP